ncbi:MAG: DUF2306 domain-containing protein [Thermoleophilaceae bacterium]|nr:DUF2306 domain-containing protein [Thermoleophilaceae bacterium]
MLNKWLWSLMFALSMMIVLLASRYFTLDAESFFPEQRQVYIAHTAGIVAHVSGAIVALALGPLQFLPALRAKRPQVHRVLGRAYLTGVLVGGVGGLYMATFAYTGIVARAGFTALALLWLSSAVMAITSIRRGDVVAHQRWMIRNFALTFAGVTLRLQLMIFGVGLEFRTGYMLAAWTCWIGNVLFAEWLIRKRIKPPAVLHTARAQFA